jgi:hypothetical protein
MGDTTTAGITRRWERWHARCRASTARIIAAARRITSAAVCGTRRGAVGFVVVTPPIGLGIAVLPPYYSTLWIGGVPYYYADNVYYTAAPDQSGYVVAPPPPDDGSQGAPPPDGSADPNAPGANAQGVGSYAQAPPQAQSASDFIIYPKQGQSKDQQAADQYECNNWAKGQTGFDPTQPNGGVAAGDADRAHSNYDRAMAACLQGRGYQVN